MSQHGCPERLSNRSKGFQEEGAGQQTMEVLVETLTGTAFEMTVSPSDTIFAIKSKIFRVEGIPVSQQHILYNLKELDDASSLREHSISDGARLRLVLGMRVGPISTRRLPPPANAEPWRDIERLLDSNRESGSWCSAGCRVTVVVLRDGGRVSLLRVRQNSDGTYSLLDTNKAIPESSSLTVVEQELDEDVAGSVHENEVTMGKMLDLRRRMETLSLQRRDKTGASREIQKTRSEESLSSARAFALPLSAYGSAEEAFAPTLYDGRYTRYDVDCSLADTYALLPPLDWAAPTHQTHLGTRSESEQSVQEEGDRLKLSDALAGSILVQGARRDDDAILEECGAEPCLGDESPLTAKDLAPIPAADYGPLVCGSARGGGAWGGAPSRPSRSRVAPQHSHSHSHSASSLHALHSLHSLQSLQSLHSLHSLQTLAAPLRPQVQPRHPPLSDALFSSSTSDLEKLKRNRILPALSRHRNREHLHLSDEGLDVAARTRLEVGSERRLRRAQHAHAHSRQRTRHDVDRLAYDGYDASIGYDAAIGYDATSYERAAHEPDLFSFDSYDVNEELRSQLRAPPIAEAPPPAPAPPPPRRAPRLRCQWCRARLGAATVHQCRCGGHYCAPHRYAEVHGCRYDYRAPQPQPQKVQAPKLPKI